MASMKQHPSTLEASVALDDAMASRAMLARGLRTPPLFFTSLGLAIAVQIGLTATALSWSVSGGGVTSLAGWSLAALVAGLAVLLAVAVVQLAAFRRLNGVWLGGLLHRVVLGTGAIASTAYVLALLGAIWAAIDSRWWLVIACSVVGGTAYALGGRQWFQAYRAEPARHAPGASAATVGLALGVALAGLALLVVYR